MAFVALVNSGMKRMTEYYFSGSGEIKCYLFNAVMTSVTAAADAKGYICIMTGATGMILLHLPHGVSATLFAAGKYPAVTVRADIHFFDRIGVNHMAKSCRNLFKSDLG